MPVGVHEDSGCAAVRHAAPHDALPEQCGICCDAQRGRPGRCGDRVLGGPPGAEVVELVDQSGEDRSCECTGAADDDALGRVDPDERSAGGPTEQDPAVRSRAVDRGALVGAIGGIDCVGGFGGLGGLAALAVRGWRDDHDRHAAG
ncbi:hypothetical protein [Curtobacterium herbarum]|uniref:Uncharacterized protein n=1 Tax=Curtobacterium herbarum TaxID=150122 RepID=A0ABP4K1B7_9MICO|nr:hypothetical protein [Curtobacterium herbarum]MBM7475246.1 hypothetical protein [Curtobacterium herbarum]MCS6543162.1 hypothetical protein [Curtobacterium herbarum]